MDFFIAPDLKARPDSYTTQPIVAGPEDEMNDLTSKTTIVVGASRGLGRRIATDLAEAGAHVVAVSRSATDLAGPGEDAGAIEREIADAADPTLPARLFDRYEPELVVLVAGAPVHMRPLQEQTWETFSVNWDSDVRMAFHWLREALLKPLRPGSRVIVFSSGAALNPTGSPLSGGYAGAKATQRFLAAYAKEEAERAGLGLTFTALLPYFAPQTGVGRAATEAYAARAGRPLEEFLRERPIVTPEIAGAAVVQLARADAGSVALNYRLSDTGLEELS
jgi:3-oxoacyl-[acyl-carrier protein] reductase